MDKKVIAVSAMLASIGLAVAVITATNSVSRFVGNVDIIEGHSTNIIMTTADSDISYILFMGEETLSAKDDILREISLVMNGATDNATKIRDGMCDRGYLEYASMEEAWDIWGTNQYDYF